MRSRRSGGLVAFGVALLAAATMAAPAGSQTTARSAETVPRVSTAGASHVLTSSALLNASIDPRGVSTSYYFQYGPTIPYASQTPTVSVGAGTARVKVGQAVAGLLPGVAYHYRAVAVYGQNKLVFGRDVTFTPKPIPLVFKLDKSPPAVVGTPFIVSGTLTGFASAHHAVVLQASPYPYLDPFTTIGATGLTDAAGRFAFRVANLSKSTQFRVSTLDLRPVYSRVTKVSAAVRVTLKVRSSGHQGLVRLFGTVTPAAVGAKVEFQLEKKARPRSSEESETATRFVSQFTTVVKKFTRTSSRFSLVVSVRRGGRYRAFVKIPAGPFVSGSSAQTVVLHAAPRSTQKRKA
jgi:hypothetical protein